MKRFVRVLFLTVLVSLSTAVAQDSDYVRIYGLIQEADSLREGGQNRLALQKYQEARAALTAFRQIHPTWNNKTVTYRLEYVDSRIAPLAAQVADETTKPSPNDSKPLAPVVNDTTVARPPAVDDQAKQLRERIRQLEADNAQLEGKLRGAASKPAAETAEIARLRAKIEVLEAKPVPFTSEELALLKAAEAKPTPTGEKQVSVAKPGRESPKGAVEAVADAQRAYASGRYRDAEQGYLRALKLDEGNAKALAGLTLAQIQQKKLAEAEANLQKARSVDRSDPHVLWAEGLLKYRQNKVDEALDATSLAAKGAPQEAEIQLLLGLLLAEKGLRSPAETAFRKALLASPGNADAHYSLALLYASQQPAFPELAFWHYQKALAAGRPPNGELAKRIEERRKNAAVKP